LARFKYGGALIRTCCAVCIGMIALVHTATCSGEPLRAKIHRGNVLYHQGLYDDALEVYNDAQIDAPESPQLHYNIGNVNYRKEDHENAIETYRKSFSTEDRLLESRANYNLGNSKYRLGEKAGNDIALWREAIEHYRKAIELDPNDEDAKFNYEFVEKKIQDEMKKQQEQQQQQQEQQQDKQKEDDRSSEQERQQQAGEQQQEEKPKEEQQQQEQEKDEGDRSEVPEQKVPTGTAQAQPQPEQEDEGLAKQEIFSILQGEEKTAREQAPALMMPYTGRVLKDW